MLHYITGLTHPALHSDSTRTLVLLGSTGSIGESALQVVRNAPEDFAVLALAGARNVERLAAQAAEFRPAHLAVLNDEGAAELRDRLRELTNTDYAPHIHVGSEGYVTLAELDGADVVLSAIVGAAGLAPTYAAVAKGRVVALANKESLVCGGHLMREAAAASGAVILPVDSEHNALFQSLAGESMDRMEHVTKLVLTASGGPFREKDAAFMRSVTPAQALKHPNWDMGAKTSIDSATLMNKGLEVIEACHLYTIAPDELDARLEVVVHPQSIVHSLVEYCDRSLIAQLGPPDMRIAIAYCLTWPRRAQLCMEPLSLTQVGRLDFHAPDTERFPCLRLAVEAYKAGPGHCVVLNAANEVAVSLFLREQIGFMDIPAVIEQALTAHDNTLPASVEQTLLLDATTRERVLAKWGHRP